MPIVHAYRRTKAFEVDLHGLVLKFEPKGEHVVCDVPAGLALDRLLQIQEAYRLHGQAPVSEDDEESDEDLSPYVLTNGDETVDLRAMDDEQLLAFAAENDVTVSPKAKGDTIRNKIVKALNSVG